MGNNGNIDLHRVDIICVGERKHESQIGTNHTVTTLTEGDLRKGLDHYIQLQLKHPHKAKIFSPLTPRAFSIASIIASSALDYLVSGRSLSVVQELGHASVGPVMPEDAVRRIFHNCSHANRIVVVLDPILMSSVAKGIYRRVFGLRVKEETPKTLEPDHLTGVCHLMINVQARQIKVLRKE